MQVDKTKENLKKCICMHCPTYTTGCKLKNLPENLIKGMGDLEKEDHFEAMYCAFNKSHCIDQDKGCVCPDCEIYKEYQLNREDYCLCTGGCNKPM